jgi:hypothetical protein
MVPASRFTSAFSTPGTAAVTFSTLAEQAAQVIPVTLNLSFMIASFIPSIMVYPSSKIKGQLTLQYIYDTILQSHPEKASMHFLVPYYLFGY